MKSEELQEKITQLFSDYREGLSTYEEVLNEISITVQNVKFVLGTKLNNDMIELQERLARLNC